MTVIPKCAQHSSSLTFTVCLQALEERDRLAQQMQQVSHLRQQLAAATEAVAESAASAAEFQEKFIRERVVRRRLHEQLQVGWRWLLHLESVSCWPVADYLGRAGVTAAAVHLRRGMYPAVHTMRQCQRLLHGQYC